MRRVHCVISGDVQGVSFRYYAMQEARRLHLVGWVRNTGDGGVECVVEGEEEALTAFVAWCEKGPRWAHVRDCTVTWGEAEGGLRDFTITG